MEGQHQGNKLSTGSSLMEEVFGSSNNVIDRGSVRIESSLEPTIVELNALKYELATLKDERERDKVRQEQALRELQQKLQEEGRDKEQERSDKNYVYQRQLQLEEELSILKEKSIQEKEALGQEKRALQAKLGFAEEENDVLRSQSETAQRRLTHQCKELQSVIDRTQLILHEAQSTSELRLMQFQECQARNDQYHEELAKLQSELALAGTKISDKETAHMLQRELSEQLTHITQLESIVRTQNIELKQLEEHRKRNTILEEQNRTLQSRTQVVDSLREQLAQAEIQTAVLNEEKLSWSSFLHNDKSGLDFHSPEQLVRTLLQDRVDKARLLEQLGSCKSKEVEYTTVILNLEQRIVELETNSGESQAQVKAIMKTQQRLERQKTLAVKEAQFLREQLRNYVSEGLTLGSESETQSLSVLRIRELEDLLDSHKQEIDALTLQLSEKAIVTDFDTIGSKRNRSDENSNLDPAFGQMTRKLRSLQDELDKALNENALALAEINSLQQRLSAAETTSQMRVLQLKDNPIRRHETVKQEKLTILKKENAELLAQLQGQAGGIKFIPVSSLESCQKEIKEMEGLVAEKEKRMMRLKEIWAKKALEFRQAVYSILGYELDFQPNGRVKVKSMFHTSDFYGGVDTGIVFDGEQGTMKLSGGQDSQFAKEIKNALKFYVEERKEIPCFLAALSLEGYEKTTRANR